jgi:peptidoglycan biosynthesis protein MviN/MurJ (putative lipid II flippase)
LINLFAGLALMQIWGAAGLAAANVLAAIVQSWLLWGKLAVGRGALSFRALRPALAKLCLAGAGMGLACQAAWPWLASFGFGPKLDASLAVAVCVPGGVCVYFAMLYLLRFEELEALKGLIRRALPGFKR